MIFKDEKGYTIVESIVANALFLAVLIPALMLLGKFTLYNSGEEKIVAQELAKAKVELLLQQNTIDAAVEQRYHGKIKWLLKTEVTDRNGLQEITVSVYRTKQGKQLAEFKTLRYKSFQR
ncbi:MAG: hypothetical protein H6696_14365 [Deferribacteres bacterium]|nr:hypothetical protein [candidate division KSB1 bacterium]MCB9503112.1 hypothetical protein [Deferribacteres bacterium]